MPFYLAGTLVGKGYQAVLAGQVLTILYRKHLKPIDKNQANTTVLMTAAAYTRYSEVINILVKARADVNAKDEYGMTALMRAAYQNTNPEAIEIIRILLNAGADVNAKDKDGKSVKDYAKNNPNSEIIKILGGL